MSRLQQIPNRYYYQFQAGTAEFSRYGLDDRKARRLFSRWLALRWNAYKAAARPGSIRDAIDNGWYDAPKAAIARTPLAAGDVIMCVPAVVIERFEISAESIKEFRRQQGWW